MYMGERVGRLRTRGVLGALVATLAIVGAGCPPPPPTDLSGGRIAVASGATAVNTMSVAIDVFAPPAALDMQLSVEGEPAGEWRAVGPAATVVLGSGDGVKVITATFRAGTIVSAPVTTSVVLDTVAPEIAVTSHHDGDTIDVSTGALAKIAGTSGDGGSGVAHVTLSALGHSSDAAIAPDGRWAHPVDSNADRALDFTIVAADVAGNTASTTLSVGILGLTSTEPNVVRPTTQTVAPDDLAAPVTDDVVLHGDHRDLEPGVSVLASGRVPGLAPERLLAAVDTVRYDASTDTTTVATVPASLLDAFARFDMTEADPGLVPSGGFRSGGLTSDTCSDELDRYDIGWSSPWIASASHPGVEFQTDSSIGLFADSSLSVDVGWWDIDVTGGMSAGVLLCSSTSVQVTAEVRADLSDGKLAELFDRFSELACFPVAGIPVCLDWKPEIRVSTKGTGTFDFSGYVGFRVGAGTDDDPDADLHETGVIGDVGLDGAAPGLSVSLSLPYIGAGLKIARALRLNLFSASFGPVLTATATGGKFCIVASADVKIELQLDLKIVTFKVKVASAKLAEAEFLCRSWNGPPPTTSTTTSTTSTTSTSTSTTSTSTTSTTTTIPVESRPVRFKIVDWFWFPETPQSVRDAMVANKPYEVWTETEDIWGFDGATRLAEGTTDASGRAWIPDSIVGPVTVHLWQDCVYNFAGPATIDDTGNEQLIEVELAQLCL